MQEFLGMEWKDIAKKYEDFNEAKQSELRKVIQQCSKDFDVPKPYDPENESFKFFALCLRTNVVLNPVLNNSRGIRSSLLGWDY